MKTKISNNYFYCIINQKHISFLNYILLLSIIQIQKPNQLFIYHNESFSSNEASNYYSKLINPTLLTSFKTQIIFKKINQNELKETLKYDLQKNGGIYLKKHYFILKNLENFLIHDYIKLDDILVGNKKIENTTDSQTNFNLIMELDFNINLKEEDSYFNINKSLVFDAANNSVNIFKNIIDYNFESYFNIIYNHYFINFDSIIYNIENEIINSFRKNEITILNLIIYYLLGYTYYFEQPNLHNNNQLNQTNQLNQVNKLSKINGINKIYYINIKRSKLRNENMIHILNKFNIDYERFEGIDYKDYENTTLTQSLKSIYFNEKETINNNTNSEYAVLSSHLNLLRKIENEENKYILILEDDVSLDFINYWDKSIEQIINEAPSDWEIIMLNYFTLNPTFESDYRPWNNEWSALSYIIKQSCIQKKMQTIYNTKNNKFNLYDDVNVADNYIFRLFKTYVYKYAYFTISNNNKSTFHNHHDNYQKIYKNMNYLILNDVFRKYF